MRGQKLQMQEVAEKGEKGKVQERFLCQKLHEILQALRLKINDSFLEKIIISKIQNR